MAKFYYQRTHKTIEVPDDQAWIYEDRKGYQRLDSPPTPPDGSVAEVLEWAGDDPARRQAALEAEQAGKNRATLLRALAD